MAQSSIGAQASRLARDLTLNSPSATSIPRLIYGTAWKKMATADLVYAALKNGFRGIDTAAQPKHYDEAGVAAGVKRAVSEGLVKRQEIFIQTKFTSPRGQSDVMPYDINASLAEKVRQSVESSLRNFTVDDAEPYIDSVVLHSPMDTIQDTLTVWRTLESYAPSKIRNLGISNATLEDIEAVFNDASLKPAVVQNRFYRDTAYEVDLRAFCRSKGIVFQSFWTITANKPLAQSPPVAKVAQGAVVGIVPAYYALVLGLDGTTILDGTTKEVHMRDDLEGIEKIGAWADGDGASEWAAALAQFKQLIREH